MRKALALSIIVSVLAVAAYFFKPSEEACVKKAREKFRSKISYTIESAPKEVDKNLFAETLEKNFLEKLEVSDQFLYRNIYERKGSETKKIGWAAFGLVQVDLK